MKAQWRELNRNLESPWAFIDWTYYFMLSAVMQRRVWLGNSPKLYPNIYVMFVAPPAIGKSSAAACAKEILENLFRQGADLTFHAQKSETENQFKKIQALSFAADCTTMESLIDQLKEAEHFFHWIRPDGKAEGQVHNSLSILLSEEMGTLFREAQTDIVPLLCHLWDCRHFSYRTKTGSASRADEDGRVGIHCDHPCAAFLGCTTLGVVKELMHKGILQQGFTARAVGVFEAEKRHRKAFISRSEEQLKLIPNLMEHFAKLLKLCGPMRLTKDAEKFFTEYYESGKEIEDRVNNSPVLADYYGRFQAHVLKLAMLISLDRHESLRPIDESCIIEAIQELRKVEVNMHMAFGGGAVNPMLDLAGELYEAIKASEDKGVMKHALLQKFIRKLPRGAHSLKEAVGILTDAGMIKEKATLSGVATVYKATDPTKKWEQVIS